MMKRRAFVKAILGSIALGTFERNLFFGAADALAGLAPGPHGVGKDSFYAFGTAYVQMVVVSRPGNRGKIVGVIESEDGEPVRVALGVEYSDPKPARGELGVDTMVQTVTEEDGTKKLRNLYADHRVVLKDGGGACMWHGSPDEARKYAGLRADIINPLPDYRRQKGLWVPT